MKGFSELIKYNSRKQGFTQFYVDAGRWSIYMLFEETINHIEDVEILVFVLLRTLMVIDECAFSANDKFLQLGIPGWFTQKNEKVYSIYVVK